MQPMDRWNQWASISKRPQFSALESCHTRSAPGAGSSSHSTNKAILHGLPFQLGGMQSCRTINTRMFWKWQRSEQMCVPLPLSYIVLTLTEAERGHLHLVPHRNTKITDN